MPAFLLRTLVSASLVLSSAAALADTVRMTGFAYGSGNVDTSMSGWVSIGQYAGTRTVDGQSESFLTFCTEITQAFYFGATYTDYQVVETGSARGLTALQAERLGKLYTLAGALMDTRDETAAFQLATWEIVHESAGNALSLSNGGFAMQGQYSQAPVSLASDWLSAITDPNATSSFNAQRLYSPSAQDFIVFSSVPLPNNVQLAPEPGSLGLAATALALLAATWAQQRSRRKTLQPVLGVDQPPTVE